MPSIHDGVERRVELAVLQRGGEVILLDEALETLELNDVLGRGHIDKPTRECRLDQDADFIDVAHEVFVDGAYSRPTVRNEDNEALPSQELQSLADRIGGGAVT